WMSFAKFETVYQRVFAEQYQVPLDEISAATSKLTRLGVAVANTQEVANILRSGLAMAPSAGAAGVYNSFGTLIAAQNQAGSDGTHVGVPGERLDAAFVAALQRASAGGVAIETDSGIVLAATMVGIEGEDIGGVFIAIDTATLSGPKEAAWHQAMKIASVLGLSAGALQLVVILGWGRRAFDLSNRHTVPIDRLKLQRKVLGLVLLTQCAALGAQLYADHQVFKAQLGPLITAKSDSAVVAMANKFELAVGYGVPLAKIPDAEATLQALVAQSPAIDLAEVSVGSVSLSAGSRRADDSYYRSARAIGEPGTGQANVYTNQSFAARTFNHLLFDLGTLGVVFLLASAEGFAFLSCIARSQRNRQAQVKPVSNSRADSLSPANEPAKLVAFPLFLYVLTEELTRSFLPRYAAGLYDGSWGISADLAASLPISAYMLVVATGTLASLLGATGRHTHHLFLLGSAVTLIGLLGTAVTQDYTQFVGFRCLSALGYAFVTLAFQNYISELPKGPQRKRALTAFISSVMLAAICGVSMGGVLVDHFGETGVFWLVSAIMVVAFMLGRRFIFRRQTADADGGSALTMRDFGMVFRSNDFLVHLGLVAIPSKMVLTGFLFYWVPLSLGPLALSPVDIARVMMMYFLVAVVVSKLSGMLADESVASQQRWIILGVVCTGVAPLLMLLEFSVITTTTSVMLLAAGQALANSAVANRMADSVAATPSAQVLGLFRVFERSGSVIGPILVGILIASVGFVDAAAGMGLIVLMAGVGLVIYYVLAWLGSKTVNHA
ncbi:MAG: MFS transporter, partial [Litorivicinus sp.]